MNQSRCLRRMQSLLLVILVSLAHSSVAVLSPKYESLLRHIRLCIEEADPGRADDCVHEASEMLRIAPSTDAAARTCLAADEGAFDFADKDLPDGDPEEESYMFKHASGLITLAGPSSRLDENDQQVSVSGIAFSWMHTVLQVVLELRPFQRALSAQRFGGVELNKDSRIDHSSLATRLLFSVFKAART